VCVRALVQRRIARNRAPQRRMDAQPTAACLAPSHWYWLGAGRPVRVEACFPAAVYLCLPSARTRAPCGAALSHILHIFIPTPRTCHAFSAERSASKLRCLRADRVRRGGAPPQSCTPATGADHLDSCWVQPTRRKALRERVGPGRATGTGSALSPRSPFCSGFGRGHSAAPTTGTGLGEPCACRAIHSTRGNKTTAAAAAGLPNPLVLGGMLRCGPAALCAALQARLACRGAVPSRHPCVAGSGARGHSEQWLCNTLSLLRPAARLRGSGTPPACMWRTSSAPSAAPVCS
jgi:hypothetical protein